MRSRTFVTLVTVRGSSKCVHFGPKPLPLRPIFLLRFLYGKRYAGSLRGVPGVYGSHQGRTPDANCLCQLPICPSGVGRAGEAVGSLARPGTFPATLSGVREMALERKFSCRTSQAASSGKELNVEKGLEKLAGSAIWMRSLPFLGRWRRVLESP